MWQNKFQKCLWSNLAIWFKEKEILLESIPLLILVFAFGEISHQRTTLIVVLSQTILVS
jgi:hypothetical protein